MMLGGGERGPTNTGNNMTDKTERKQAWMIIVGDGQLLRIIASPLGPSQWRRRVARSNPNFYGDVYRSPTNRALKVVGEHPALNHVGANKTVKRWEEAIAPYRYSGENLTAADKNALHGGNWFYDRPEVWAILESTHKIIGEEDPEADASAALTDASKATEDAIRAITEVATQLAKSLGPRRRVPTYDSAGNIIAIHDIPDGQD
jgi:hypothetical protein